MAVPAAAAGAGRFGKPSELREAWICSSFVVIGSARKAVFHLHSCKRGTGEGFYLFLVCLVFFLVCWSSLSSYGIEWKAPLLPQHRYSLLILVTSEEKAQSAQTKMELWVTRIQAERWKEVGGGLVSILYSCCGHAGLRDVACGSCQT